MKAFGISVTITEHGNKMSVYAQKGESLRTVLDRAGLSYALPCGGMGTCGGCKVRFLEGGPAPCEDERRILSEKEITEGVRLLCKSVVSRDCVIDIGRENDDGGMVIENLRNGEPVNPGDADNCEKELYKNENVLAGDGFAVAIDLGTTTIAAALIRNTSDSYEVIHTNSCVNRQRKYGSDVISRISAASDREKAKELKSLVSEDIENLIKELSAKEGITSCGKDADIRNITISGNTTMLHLLTGKDVTGLGQFPYTPVSVELEQISSEAVFSGIKDVELILLPGISGFVGADITAGLFSLTPSEREKFFFLDLGTNGEMVFFDGKKLKVTSAAAGPVFEAGGITCGVASVPGAISHVRISSGADDDKNGACEVNTETIDGAAPVGICGTGVMELTSELLRNNLIDETGLLTDRYFEEGFPVTEDGSIRFTQNDIRNVQLAKAAILTGAGTLLDGGVPDRVYIAGGFGSSIFAEKIAKLKMFPEAFDGKIVSVGNSALKGAALFASCVLRGGEAKEEALKRLGKIVAQSEVIELAEADSFDETYIEAMNF